MSKERDELEVEAGDFSDADDDGEYIDIAALENIVSHVADRMGEAHLKGLEQRTETERIRAADAEKRRTHELELAKIDENIGRLQIESDTNLRKDLHAKGFWWGVGVLIVFGLIVGVGAWKGNVKETVEILKELALMSVAGFGLFKWGESNRKDK